VRQSARRDAKSDTVPSVERRNAAVARRDATRRAGAFRAAGASKDLPVGTATRCALLLPATRNASGAAVQSGRIMLEIPELLRPWNTAVD
jgi:hypothetical protein